MCNCAQSPCPHDPVDPKPVKEGEAGPYGGTNPDPEKIEEE